MRARAIVVMSAALGLSAVTSCRGSRRDSNDALPSRPCNVVVWHRPQSASSHVEVVGDWNDWARPGQAMGASGSPGWLVTSIAMSPGEHLYAIVEDGTWLADANVPTTGFHEGQEVSWTDLADCSVPGLQVSDATGSAGGHATVAAKFVSASSNAPIDLESLEVTERDGSRVAPASVSLGPGAALSLGFTSLSAGNHTLMLQANDTRGRVADPAWATVWIAPQPYDPRDQVLYQVIVDRYRGPNDAPLANPSTPSERAGGTISGVRAAIEAGELTKLGVTSLWLSPLYANPDGLFPGADGHEYSSYHGYWPSDARAVESKLGTASDVDALLASAHAHGIRVLFDVVPNHVHAENPYAVAHLDGGWFNHPDGSCICGSATCDWATHILDCWFIGYLPDLDWRNPTVADQITSDVAWWLDRFDADGLRIDAVPMMPRAANRRIGAAVRAKYDHPSGSVFILGENFVGPDDFDLLKYQLGPSGLDSEFHFPLMWALRGAIANETEAMSAIDVAVQGGIDDWAGSGAVMSLIIGNHDVDRFATESAGDGSGDGWTPAVQPPTTSDVYAKQTLALGTIFALPGVPTVFQGDEVALVGHVDPDSRRVLPADSDLNAAQLSTRATMEALTRIRACSPSLRRGTYRTLFADAEHLAFARELPGAETVVVLLFRRAASLTASFPGIAAGDRVDALTGHTTSLSPELTTVSGAPLSLQLLFPSGSSCATSAQ